MNMLKKVLFLALISMISIGALFAAGQQSKDEKTKIEYFSMKREIYDILEKLIADFEKENPNIDVEQTLVPDADRILATRISGGDTPEIFSNWPTPTWKAQVDAGYIMELTGSSIFSRISDDARAAVQRNGKDYMVPIAWSTMGVFYNKDIFAKYNLVPPRTFEELLRICETLKSNGITPFLINGKEIERTRQAMDVYISSMADYKTLENDIIAGRVDMNKPYGQQVRQLGARLVQLVSHAQSDVLGSGNDQLLNDFATGRGAMQIDGSWSIPMIQKANPNMNFSMFPFPGVNAADTVATVGIDYALCLSSTAKHPEESKKFLEFMVRAASGQYYAEKDGSISCLRGISYVAPQQREQRDFMEGGTGRVLVYPENYWDIGQADAIGTANQQLYMDKNVETWVRTLQGIWNK
jgi:raffinose/stachyose/melibiose transport system substrate-binding protein